VKYRLLPALILILTGMSAVGIAIGNEKINFAPNVNMKTGAISVPENYTRWATLGTWAHANNKADEKLSCNRDQTSTTSSIHNQKR
jgi:hypothetical protein